MVNSPEELNPSDADQTLNDDAAPSQGAAGSEPWQQELAEAHDRLLRTQAELENYRRRTQREMQDERRFANQSLLIDLLPVLDNMERAIDAAQQSSEGKSLLDGFKMLHQLLISTLGNHHCRQIEAAGTTFDPSRHEAIAQSPSVEFPAGTVLQVAQQGYQLHDRVIRPAQVVVSSGSPEAS